MNKDRAVVLIHVHSGSSLKCGGVAPLGLAAGLSCRSGDCLLPLPVLAHVWCGSHSCSLW